VAREYTYQSPPYLTRFNYLDSSADAADSTDKPTVALKVAGTTVVTGTAVTAGNTVTRITTVDAGKSEYIPANSKLELVISFGGTAANVLGIIGRLSLTGSN
jgi:hypothetical protein